MKSRTYACYGGKAVMQNSKGCTKNGVGVAVRTVICCLSMFSASAPIFGREINVLLIHGRLHNTHERYGHFRSDQSGAWNSMRPISAGNVWYVQWDAWNRYFDDHSWPGGEAVVRDAIDALCDANKGQACWILCHSVGCAAFEDYLSKSDYAHNSILIEHVMAADSAAGGSELADNGLLRWIGGLSGQSGRLDNSLKTSYARDAYNHNNMQSVVVRGVGGATDNYPLHFLIACNFFPRQTGSNLNSKCTPCVEGRFGPVARECSDGTVALHSTGAHNRKASFQDCNSRIPPHHDAAGTYGYHGWWINDHVCDGDFRQSCNWNGPYSKNGKSLWNSGFKTYHVDHSDAKAVVVDEYSAAPAALCP